MAIRTGATPSSPGAGIEIVDASLRYRTSEWHNGCSAGWRLGDVVDILRTPSRIDERRQLCDHVIRWRGYSARQAEEFLYRLEDAFTLDPGSAPDSSKPDEASRVDQEYEKFLKARKSAQGAGGSQRRRISTVFVYDLALRNLTDLPPHGRNLSSTRAKVEILSNTALGRAAVTKARQQVATLGRRTNWDVSKMLDATEQRYEKRELVAEVHRHTISLDAFRNTAADTGLEPSFRERALSRRQDRAAARRRAEKLKKERVEAYLAKVYAAKREATLGRQARRRMPGPNGLNVAVQPFLRGEKPLGTLKKSDLEGFYELPCDRVEAGLIHTLNMVLHFPSAMRQLLMLQGRNEEEAAACLGEILVQRTPFLRREKFRDVTGITTLVKYKPAKFTSGTKSEQALHRIAWSQMGFFSGQDVTKVLGDEEIRRILAGLGSGSTKETTAQRKKPADRYVALKPFIPAAVRKLGKARPHQLQKLCRSKFGWPIAHETVKKYCDILAKEGLLRRRLEFDNRRKVEAGSCRQRKRRVLYLPARGSA